MYFITPIIACGVLLCTAFYQSAWRAISQAGWYGCACEFSDFIGFFASCIATYQQSGDVYFESVAMFTFFLLASRFLKKKACKHATQQANNLYKNQPLSARKKENGIFKTVAAHTLKVDDIVQVAAGEKVPADGVILEGKTTLEESLLTGEHMPVLKQVHDHVFAGCVNLEQPVLMQVTAVGAQQFIGQLVRQYEQAAQDKPRIAQKAEIVARYFVPGLLLVAALTYGMAYG